MEKIKKIILKDSEIKQILNKALNIKIGMIRRNNRSGEFILIEKQVDMKVTTDGSK